jgi:hypothetical protein
MSSGFSPEALHGRWLRMPEQEKGGEQVYMRDRGMRTRPRPVLECRADGTCTDTTIGPTDRTINRPARWELDGDLLRFYESGKTTPTATMRIVELTDDRLVLEPC